MQSCRNCSINRSSGVAVVGAAAVAWVGAMGLRFPSSWFLLDLDPRKSRPVLRVICVYIYTHVEYVWVYS